MIKYWASPSRAATLAILQLCPVAHVRTCVSIRKRMAYASKACICIVIFRELRSPGPKQNYEILSRAKFWLSLVLPVIDSEIQPSSSNYFHVPLTLRISGRYDTVLNPIKTVFIQTLIGTNYFPHSFSYRSFHPFSLSLEYLPFFIAVIFPCSFSNNTLQPALSFRLSLSLATLSFSSHFCPPFSRLFLLFLRRRRSRSNVSLRA